MIRSFPPHPNSLPPPGQRSSGLAARGEGRPFIPPAEMGGILEYFDKIESKGKVLFKVRLANLQFPNQSVLT